MGDEAEAYMDRAISLPHEVTVPSFVQVRHAMNEGYNAGLEKGFSTGYKKGFDSARGQFLMKFGKWIGGDFYDWETPIWLAHVAVEKFECGCMLDVNYDRGLEPDVCSKWQSATQEQKLELFQNTYGYSYRIWRMKQEQETKQRATRLHRMFEEQKARDEEADRKVMESVDERLLP